MTRGDAGKENSETPPERGVVSRWVQKGNGLSALMIRIVHPPAGEAPDNIRAAWVGLVLPVAGPQCLVVSRTQGVLSGPRGRLGGILHILLGRTKSERGYRVKSAIAIDCLSKHAPDAAEWWRQNTPHLLKPNGVILFQEAACTGEDANLAAG